MASWNGRRIRPSSPTRGRQGQEPEQENPTAGFPSASRYGTRGQGLEQDPTAPGSSSASHYRRQAQSIPPLGRQQPDYQETYSANVRQDLNPSQSAIPSQLRPVRIGIEQDPRRHGVVGTEPGDQRMNLWDNPASVERNLQEYQRSHQFTETGNLYSHLVTPQSRPESMPPSLQQYHSSLRDQQLQSQDRPTRQQQLPQHQPVQQRRHIPPQHPPMERLQPLPQDLPLQHTPETAALERRLYVEQRQRELAQQYGPSPHQHQQQQQEQEEHLEMHPQQQLPQHRPLERQQYLPQRPTLGQQQQVEMRQLQTDGQRRQLLQQYGQSPRRPQPQQQELEEQQEEVVHYHTPECIAYREERRAEMERALDERLSQSQRDGTYFQGMELGDDSDEEDCICGQ